MSETLTVILITVGAVALFVLGLSITLILKGHNIKSEIGDNENMKRLGIRCAAQQMRDEERELRGDVACAPGAECSDAGCGTCLSEKEEK